MHRALEPLLQQLAGRDELRETVHIAVERVRRGLPAKSTLMVGLRGVGKTVLLDRMRNDAEGGGIHTVSVFNGPLPTILTFKSESEEIEAVGGWLAQQAKAGFLPHEFGLFVRSAAQLDRAIAAVREAGIPFKILDEHVETASGHASVSTVHLAKGLEFRAVAVVACDDEIIPLQERIETVGDDADLQEVYDTERHLL